MGEAAAAGERGRTIAEVAMWTLTIGFLLYCVIGSWPGDLGGNPGDFRHFYNAGLATLRGDHVYLADAHVEASGYLPGGGGWVYPPVLALVFAPLALLPPGLAGVAWATLMGPLHVAGLWVFSREVAHRLGLPTDRRAVLAVVTLAQVLVADRLLGLMLLGQTDVLLVAPLAFALAVSRRGRWAGPIGAGVLIAAAASIKYLAIAFLPYLLIRGRWRVAAGLVGGMVALNLLPALVYGWERNLEYLSFAFAGVLRMAGVPAAEGAAAVNPLHWEFSVSFPSAFARWAVHLDPDDPSKALVLGGTLAVLAPVVALAWWQYTRLGFALWRGVRDGRREGLEGVEWGLLVLVSLIFSPQAAGRHFYLMVLPFAVSGVVLILGTLHGPRRVAWRALLAVTVLAWLGYTFPPGNADNSGALGWWRGASGTSACILPLLFVLIAESLRLLGPGGRATASDSPACSSSSENAPTAQP